MLIYSSTFRSLRSGRTRPAGARDDSFTSPEPKKRPLSQRRLVPVPSLHPRPVGRVETRPRGLRHRRDNSRRPRAALGAAEGESYCRLGFAVAGRLRCLRFGHGIRERFVAPAQAGVQALDPCCFDLGVPSVGGDWPGLAPAGDHLSCGDKKGALANKSTALGSSGLGGARDAHVLEYIPLAALRPHPICRRSRRFLHKPGAKETSPAAAPARAGALAPPASGGSRRNSPWRAQTSTRQFPPAAGCARRCRRGRPLPARLGHCRRVVVPSFMARHSHTIRRPGPGGLQDSGSCCSVCEGAAAAGYWPGQALTAHRSGKGSKLVLVF